MTKQKTKTESKTKKASVNKTTNISTVDFVGFVIECHERKYAVISALNPNTNDRFNVRVCLSGKDYDVAVRCLVHKIPVVFEGEVILRPEGMTWIMEIEKPHLFKPTQEVDLSEKIDEQNINPKPKRKKLIKLCPRQWNALMQDAIEWIEEDLAKLKEKFVAYVDSPTCQFIEGQQNTGISLLGSITSLSDTVNRAKEVIEAHFEDRLAVVQAIEKEVK